jgi:hypothetical protein
VPTEMNSAARLPYLAFGMVRSQLGANGMQKSDAIKSGKLAVQYPLGWGYRLCMICATGKSIETAMMPQAAVRNLRILNMVNLDSKSALHISESMWKTHIEMAY